MEGDAVEDLASPEFECDVLAGEKGALGVFKAMLTTP